MQVNPRRQSNVEAKRKMEYKMKVEAKCKINAKNKNPDNIKQQGNRIIRNDYASPGYSNYVDSLISEYGNDDDDNSGSSENYYDVNDWRKENHKNAISKPTKIDPLTHFTTHYYTDTRKREIEKDLDRQGMPKHMQNITAHLPKNYAAHIKQWKKDQYKKYNITEKKQTKQEIQRQKEIKRSREIQRRQEIQRYKQQYLSRYHDRHHAHNYTQYHPPHHSQNYARYTQHRSSPRESPPYIQPSAFDKIKKIKSQTIKTYNDKINNQVSVVPESVIEKCVQNKIPSRCLRLVRVKNKIGIIQVICVNDDGTMSTKSQFTNLCCDEESHLYVIENWLNMLNASSENIVLIDSRLFPYENVKQYIKQCICQPAA